MDLQAIEARLEAATLGPWRRPEPKIYDSYVALEDCGCANGWDNGESRITLEESGLEDEDGNEYHRHTETDYHHVIGSNGHGVTGNYDWEAGGIMEEADTEFIAHAPEDIRALIEEVGRLTVEHLEMRIERDNLRERRDYYRKAVMKADCEIEAVEALHRPAHAVFSWTGGTRYDDPCPECHGAPGVHPCGCWADTQIEYVCAECHRLGSGSRGVYNYTYPCPTMRALDGEAE